VDVIEPFEGKEIGFLNVLGRSEDYYEELVGRFDDIDAVLTRRRIALQQKPREESLQLPTPSSTPRI
jgi:hypothetical protein